MGWTITIVRNKKGKDILNALLAADRIEVRSIGEFENSLKVLRRLARKSRERVPAAGVHGQMLSYSGR